MITGMLITHAFPCVCSIHKMCSDSRDKVRLKHVFKQKLWNQQRHLNQFEPTEALEPTKTLEPT